ncbi:MAG: histone deacetylase family protein [Gammaproteobacteria bacterium]|nr:histone deacetylase family protein [Gammaproteobacteria bacterium]
MSVTIISHPDCLSHSMGDYHPEAPTRITAIQDHLVSSGLDFVLKSKDAKPIQRELLELAHEKNYIDYIFTNAPATGTFELDPDTSMNPYTLNAALLSAGAAVEAVDLVMNDETGAAFCATRPPGHHAMHSKAMGFCFFNNIAIAALYAREKYQLQRVAIVDFDVHHGNGTEDILTDKEGFLFCSLFQHPFYPFSGTMNTADHIVNTPLPASTSGPEFQQQVTDVWLPALNNFKPELILISAGFDAHAEDDISNIRLVENDYRWVTEQMVAVAAQYAGGRIVSVLEGGYALSALGRSVTAHIDALLGG